jgi:hypothetical protein
MHIQFPTSETNPVLIHITVASVHCVSEFEIENVRRAIDQSIYGVGIYSERNRKQSSMVYVRTTSTHTQICTRVGIDPAKLIAPSRPSRP